MSDVTRVLSAIEAGDPQAAERLLPLVYGELRKLAAHRLAQEKPGQTLQATALVHDAYLRLVDTERAQHSNNRGHFPPPARERTPDELAALDNALAKLAVEDPAAANLVKLRFFADFSVEEAAEAL